MKGNAWFDYELYAFFYYPLYFSWKQGHSYLMDTLYHFLL